MPPPPRNPRRTTLGGIHLNAMETTPSKIPKPRNSRKSMLPRMGRENNGFQPPSPTPSTTSTTSRRSTHMRRSMTGAGRPSMGAGRVVKQDPRPIQDKVYQQQCIRTLLAYLSKSGYEYPVSLKSLARPSGKDFQHIVTFLLKQVDPTFGDGKFEEEVSQQFKALGYPFSVSKTALVAAGSPHTWPALLAALTWLVEHNVVALEDDEEDDTQDGTFASLGELEQKTDKAFFKYLGRAYSAFLEGSQETCDQLTEQLMDMFERDNMVIEGEIERLTDLNETIVERINVFRSQSESLPDLFQKREEYATSLEQFEDLVRQMDDHHSALAIKVNERVTELKETEGELERLTTRLENLRTTIQRQELSVLDVQKLNAEHARNKEALEKNLNLKQLQKDRVYSSQQELVSLWDDLECVVREYNEQAAALSRQISELWQWKMNVNKHTDTSDQAKLLGLDLRNEVRPRLKEMMQRNVHLLADARRDLEQLLDDLEAANETYTESVDRNKMIDAKLTKLEETMETERESQEAALDVRLSEVASIEARMQALRDASSLEEQIFAHQRQCDQLDALQRQQYEETVAKKRSIQGEIQNALAVIEEYNLYVSSTLKELGDYATNQKRYLKSLD